MNVIMRSRLTNLDIPRSVPGVGFRLPGTVSDRRRYSRALMSALRRGTLLIALALLAMISLAARGGGAFIDIATRR
jgi:hypothetical protein